MARYILTRQEVEYLIHQEAQARLGMSGEEFLRRRKDGTLSGSVAKRDIEMLVNLIDAKENKEFV